MPGMMPGFSQGICSEFVRAFISLFGCNLMGFRKAHDMSKKKKKSQVCQIFVLEQQILFKIPEPPSFFLI